MGEGRLQCQIIAAATLLLARSALAAALRARRAAGGAPAGGRGPGARAAGTGARTGAPAKHAFGSGSGGGGGVPAVLALCVALLACNHLLQRIGLIDRFGQDPHDKSEPTGELLGPSDAALRARHLAATLGPLGGLWLLWVLADTWLARHLSGGGSSGSGGGGSAVVVLLARAAAAGGHAAVGLFWWAQLTGRAGATAADALAGLGRRLGSGLAPLAEALAALAAPLGRGPGAAAAREALRLPLRLLLPRVAYMLALLPLAAAVALAAALAAAGLAARALQRAPSRPPNNKPARASPERGGDSGAGAAPARAALWLVASMSGAVTMVLGYKGPAIVFLGAAQALCLVCLLAARKQARRLPSAGAAAGGPLWALLAWPDVHPAAGRQLRQGAAAPDGGPPPDDSLALAAFMFGMYGLQLFFCSGHFCEFSGLQYASSFIGFDDMEWYVSGPLLLVNTFGPLMLACAALPLAAAALGAGGAGGGGGLEGPLLLASGGRAAALAVCVASAAVQQGHILLWAIFAPKLVFEMWLCAVADAFLLLAAVAAPAAAAWP